MGLTQKKAALKAVTDAGTDPMDGDLVVIQPGSGQEVTVGSVMVDDHHIVGQQHQSGVTIRRYVSYIPL